MSKKSFVTIMAGGIGSRFWPLSRGQRPKQFLDILGIGKSLVQMTYERFRPYFAIEDIYVVTSEQYIELVKTQLPELPIENIIAEPQRKNTATCIAYSAFKLNHIRPDSTMIVTPADHLIIEQDNFIETIKDGIDFVQKNDALLTLGIQPTTPHTGYGYIQFENSSEKIKPVKLFTEKPNLAFAKQFVASGDFLWNSGIFLWNTTTILNSFQQHLPDIYDALSKIDYNTANEWEQIKEAYSLCPSISIDYGILEKEHDIFVKPAYFTWSDLGTWNAMYDINKKDENLNVVNNKEMIHLKSVSKSIVHSFDKKKLIVLQDVKDLIVVDTEDALVICNKNSEQKLKEIVNYLSTKNFEEFL